MRLLIKQRVFALTDTYDVYDEDGNIQKEEDLTVKKITAFLLTGCPYCRNGLKAYKELCEEHPKYR